MGSDLGQIFSTASLHRDHSISYALVCEKELSHMCKNNGNPDLVCKNMCYHNLTDSTTVILYDVCLFNMLFTKFLLTQILEILMVNKLL